MYMSMFDSIVSLCKSTIPIGIVTDPCCDNILSFQLDVTETPSREVGGAAPLRGVNASHASNDQRGNMVEKKEHEVSKIWVLIYNIWKKMMLEARSFCCRVPTSSLWLPSAASVLLTPQSSPTEDMEKL